MLKSAMPLFENRLQIIYFCAFCLLVLIFSLSKSYYDFSSFKAKPIANIKCAVLKSEQKQSKQGKFYYLNYFKCDDFNIYTYSKEQKIGHSSLKISTQNIKFLSFLKQSFFAKSFDFKPLMVDESLSERIAKKIRSQHQSAIASELYNALFLALPISKQLRNAVTNWGIAHLIAISGFHLALLFSIFYFFFSKPYEWLQTRYFPWRNRHFDLSLVVLILGGFYLYILDFTASFLRSYIMALIGFILLSRGIFVFRFANLFLCVLLVLCLEPKFLFSLGFYFSALGVFFIFVYIRHFGEAKQLKHPLKIAAHALFFNIFVFCAMNIPVYYFFAPASFFQLSVIPLSLVFVVFYPLSIALHLFGYGGIFDEYLLKFLFFAKAQTSIHLPLWIFVCFNLFLPLTIRYKSAAIGLSASGGALYLYYLL